MEPPASRAIEFDLHFYRLQYSDLDSLTDTELRLHYERFGRVEGRVASPHWLREQFVQLLDAAAPTLEIGPFAMPIVRGDHVRYADAFATEELRRRAAVHDLPVDECPTIDYVLSETPLGDIDDRFAQVLSSHCIEHQPDLIGHFRDVAHLLDEGGAYFVIVPDHRYCFDHFRPPSTIAAMIAAHAQSRTRHSFDSWISFSGLRTHNDPERHWAGQHGAPHIVTGGLDVITRAIEAFNTATTAGEYVDCHAWQFTPASFRDALTTLSGLGLCPFDVEFVGETPAPRLEFCALLRKRTTSQTHTALVAGGNPGTEAPPPKAVTATVGNARAVIDALVTSRDRALFAATNQRLEVAKLSAEVASLQAARAERVALDRHAVAERDETELQFAAERAALEGRAVAGESRAAMLERSAAVRLSRAIDVRLLRTPLLRLLVRRMAVRSYRLMRRARSMTPAHCNQNRRSKSQGRASRSHGNSRSNCRTIRS